MSLNGSHSPPVHRACTKDSLDILKLMVEAKGAEVLLARDKQGRTTLHSCALSSCSGDVIEYLVENRVMVNTQDQTGLSPLANAILIGATSAAESLLKNGTDPSAKDKNGYNALHLAIAGKGFDFFETVMASDKADVLLQDFSNNRLQPIHYALRIGHIDMLSWLQPHLKTDLKDEGGNNLVHHAVLSKNSKTLAHILNCRYAQAMINEPNHTGLTPLHQAAMKADYCC